MSLATGSTSENRCLEKLFVETWLSDWKESVEKWKNRQGHSSCNHLIPTQKVKRTVVRGDIKVTHAGIKEGIIEFFDRRGKMPEKKVMQVRTSIKYQEFGTCIALCRQHHHH